MMRGYPWKLCRSPISPPVLRPIGSGLSRFVDNPPIPSELSQLLFPGNQSPYYSEEEWPRYSYRLKDFSIGVGALRDKRTGRCYDFDGTNDFVTAALVSASPTAGTLCAWIYDNATGADGRIVSFGTVGNRGFDLMISSGNLRIQLASTSANYTTYDHGTPLTAGWHHVAVTHTGTTVVVYLDGVAVSVTPSAMGTGFSGTRATTELVRAGVAVSGTGYFTGKLYDTRVYSVAKTADEILAIYTQAATPGEIDKAELLLHWPMQEEAGTLAYDTSGNGYLGTHTNTSVVSFHATDAGVRYSFPNEHGFSIGSNLRSNSDAISGWNLISATTSANTANNIYGTATMDSLIASASSARHYAWNALAVTSGTAYTVSCFAKAGSGGTLILGDAGDNDWHVAEFNLSDGSVIALNSTVQTGSELINNGIYRCWVTFTRTNTSDLNMVVGVGKIGTPTINSVTMGTWLGAGEFIYVGGAQIVAGTHPLGYVATGVTAESKQIVIPAINTTHGADLTSLQFTGRCPNYGLIKDYAWQGDGASVYVLPGQNIIPSSADFELEFKYYHATASAARKLALAQDTNVFRVFQADANTYGTGLAGSVFCGRNGTGGTIASALTDNSWHSVRIVRLGSNWTMTVNTKSVSWVDADAVGTGTSALLATNSGALPTTGRLGPVTVVSGGVTTVFVPIPGTRDIALLVDGVGSVGSNAILNGTLVDLHTEGDGSWQSPAVVHGADWDGTGLYAAIAPLNVSASKAPVSLDVDRTGGIVAPSDYSTNRDGYAAEEFDDISVDNSVNKRFSERYASDRYGSGHTDISLLEYFEA